MEEIIAPVDRNAIKEELTSERLLRQSNKGENELYIVNAHNAPATMREIGRLREIAFREGGGGTGLACDIDEFDTMPVPCQQLIVWDPDKMEIIGGYRFILGEDIEIHDGLPRIATSHLFHFSEKFLKEILPHTLELGRSFVTLEYQNTRERPKGIYALDNLWDGLGAIAVLNPHIQYLFGKVTMYPVFGAYCRDLLLGFIHRYFPDPEKLVTPLEPLDSAALSREIQDEFRGDNFKEDYRRLTHLLREKGRNIPPLVNAYMGLSPTMRMFGTAINREFGDVEESGILLKISDIFEEKKQRHMSCCFSNMTMRGR